MLILTVSKPPSLNNAVLHCRDLTDVSDGRQLWVRDRGTPVRGCWILLRRPPSSSCILRANKIHGLTSVLQANGETPNHDATTACPLPAAIEKRYGGIVDSVSLDFVPGTSAATRRAVIAAVQRIPSTFKGFRR